MKAEELAAIKLKELTKKEKKILEKQEAADNKLFRESFEKNKIIKFNVDKGIPQIGVMFSEVVKDSKVFDKYENSWHSLGEIDPSKVNVKIRGKPDPIEIKKSAITEVIPIPINKQPKYKLRGRTDFIVNYKDKRYRLIDENFSSLDFLGKENIDPNADIQYVYDIKEFATDSYKKIPEIKDVSENDLRDITPLFNQGDVVRWTGGGYSGQYHWQDIDDGYYIGRITTVTSKKNENNINHIFYEIDNVLNHEAYDIFNIEHYQNENVAYSEVLENLDKNSPTTVEEKKLSKYGGCPAKSIETFELLYNIKENKGNKPIMIQDLRNILNNNTNFPNCTEFVRRIRNIVNYLAPKLPQAQSGGKKKKRTRKMKKHKTLKKRYHPKNKYTL